MQSVRHVHAQRYGGKKSTTIPAVYRISDSHLTNRRKAMGYRISKEMAVAIMVQVIGILLVLYVFGKGLVR
jgi:hypothetical protein